MTSLADIRLSSRKRSQREWVVPTKRASQGGSGTTRMDVKSDVGDFLTIDALGNTTQCNNQLHDDLRRGRRVQTFEKLARSQPEEPGTATGAEGRAAQNFCGDEIRMAGRTFQRKSKVERSADSNSVLESFLHLVCGSSKRRVYYVGYMSRVGRDAS